MVYLYLALLALQLGLMIWCGIKPSKKGFIWQLSIQGLCTVSAIILWIYYENLPVSPGAIMPGLVYFSETLSSFFATIVYGVMFVISAFGAVIRWPGKE